MTVLLRWGASKIHMLKRILWSVSQPLKPRDIDILLHFSPCAASRLKGLLEIPYAWELQRGLGIFASV